MVSSGNVLPDCRGNGVALRSTKHVGPSRQSDRPLCVFTNRNAGHSQAGSLFLNSARIRNDQFSVSHQTKKVQITERFDHPDTRLLSRLHSIDTIRSKIGLQLMLLDLLLRSWVGRKNDGLSGRDLLQSFENFEKHVPAIDIRWTVKRE